MRQNTPGVLCLILLVGERERVVTKMGKKGIFGVFAAAALVGVLCLGVVLPAFQSSTKAALPESETVASAVYPLAESYSSEAEAQFASVMHIDNGTGETLTLADMPSGSYSGFLFKLADAAQGSGDVSAAAQEAAEQGIITQVHDNLYSVTSLDTLAGLFSADQLEYVEPNATVHLMGEVDGEAEEAEGILALSDEATLSSASAEADTAVDDTADSFLTAESLGTLGGTSTNPAPTYPPSDPYYVSGKLWNLDMLNVEGAWELGLDGDPYVHNSTAVRDTPVKVAVIDTGLYGTGTTEEQHEDIDYNHVVDGYNFATTDEGEPDVQGHGTFVSGLIAAKVNNAVGVAGAAPGAYIVPCKVFDSSDASTEDVVSAIYYAVDEAKVDVINMSLGSEYNDTSLQEACDYAVEQGVIVVASAGNDGVSTPNYPAAYDSVVGVASVDSDKARSTWSQYGKSVFVTAPGESVTSTYYGSSSSYTTASGTSFSGPEVAALAAICRAVYPDMTQDVFKDFLIQTSTDLGSAGYDDYYGYGLVNFEAMGQTVLASQTLPWYNISFNVTAAEGGAAIQGATVTLTAAEDISWDDDAEEGIEAGSWPAGTVIAPESDGTFKVHRGVYNYTVSADGYYMTTGQVKTYAAAQTTDVQMEQAYAVNLRVQNSKGGALTGVHLAVTSMSGRTETAVTGQSQEAGVFTYNLMSGIYSFEASVESGYEKLRGQFTVQREGCDITLTLYASDELSDVSFTAYDSEEEVAEGEQPTPLTQLGTAVYDAQGLLVSPQEDGTYRLARGVSYKAILTRLGYEDAIQNFTVDDAESVSLSVAMIAAECSITLRPVTEDGTAITTATITVTDSAGQVKSPSASDAQRYNLKAGTYTYTIEAPGYATASASFSVAIESRTLTVVMTAQPQTVTFNITDAATGDVLSAASVKLTTATSSTAIRANADGTYSLAPGDYRYSVYCLNYQSQRGSFTVLGEDMTVNVALEAYSGGAEGFAGGSGTAEDPYLIATEDQLRYLANQTDVVRSGVTDAETNQQRTIEGYFQLVSDIQLTSAWLPIGNYENSSNYVAFGGTFDGAGHTISGLSTVESDYDAQGLFGVVQNATIMNLTVEGQVTGQSYVGGIVGMVRFFYDDTYSDWNTGTTRIENCCNRANVTGRYSVGGIAGNTGGSSMSSDDYGTRIISCSNYGTIHAQRNGAYDKRSSAAGGIVGSGGNCRIDFCYNRGTVEAGYVAGGIAGQSLGLLAAYNCYNAGTVYEHETGTGYAGTSGSIAGRLVSSVVIGCFGLVPADESAVYTPFGGIDSYTTISDYQMYDRAGMWRNADFLTRLNTDVLSDTVTTNFVEGNSYPMLRWEVSADAVLAEEPYVTAQPASPSTSYKQDEKAEALTAQVQAVSDGGMLSWQWYEAADEDGNNAWAIEGASGTGATASYTPSTSDLGTRYYFARFTNTLTVDEATGSASADTLCATVITRSNVDAQIPTITAYNPSAAQQFNTQLSAKITTDLILSVEAGVEDGGTLSYQWYKGSSMTGTGTRIAGATDASYYPDTYTLGTMYYYVEVTNTYEPGNTASVKSDWVAVTVNEYTISSLEELLSFRTAVNSGVTFEGLIVTLTCDLDVSSMGDWEPIGTSDHPFMGTFMGGSGYSGSEEITTHTISGIHIDGAALSTDAAVEGSDRLGFFGVVRAATICDVVVDGTITGKANRYAGLLVGSAYSSGSTSTTIENCATTGESSVEGKYCIGGLVGYGCANVVDCANHGTVTGYGFIPTTEDTSLDTYSYTTKAVGGVVGYLATAYAQGCYNTGSVSVAAIDTTAGQKCAYYVGGVVGCGATTAGVISCFDSGAVSAGTKASRAISFKPAGVVYAGAVVGYQAYDYLYNIHYLDGAAGEDGVGTNGSSTYDYGENHTLAFMKTAYFTGLMQDGYGYGAAFRQSVNGVPHLVWESDATSGSNLTDAAEAYIYDVTIDQIDDITSTWETYFYQGENAPDVVVWADQAQPEGGVLTYAWQTRAVGAGDDAWEAVEGASGTCVATSDGAHYTASMPINTSSVGAAEYRCVITNTLEGATGTASIDNEIPALTIEIREDAGVFSLADPTAANSSENPWIITTAKQLHFLAQLVNGETKMVGLADATFYRQYLAIDADLDLSDYAQWEPIGTGDTTSGTPFMGILDGRGHAITGLSIGTAAEPAEAADYQALFGSVCYGAVRNLCVSGIVNVGDGSWMTGGIVAYAYGAALQNLANHVDVTGTVRVGGIAGTVGTCQVKDCVNTGTIGVQLAESQSQYSVGGIAGYSFHSVSGVEGAGLYNCLNLGSVSCTLAYGTDPRFGAVLGEDSTGTTPISNCYYLAGSATCLNDGSAGTGLGDADGYVEDAEGSLEAVEDAGDARIAWLLNTSGGEGDHSGRWGVSTQDDQSQAVGLTLCGASTVYRVDTTAAAAQITVSSEYVTEGTQVTASWRDKPGFVVSDVAWGKASADPTDEGAFSSVENGGSFVMPASDVVFTVAAEQDTAYRYNLYASVVDETGAASQNATVSFDALDDPPTAREGDTVNVSLTVAQGYQLQSVSAAGLFGTKVSVECVDGLNYRFIMPADLVQVNVVVEPEGSAAAKQATSLTISKDNLHIYRQEDEYRIGNLYYATVAMSGTLVGQNRYFESNEMERASNTPALYEQTYSFGDGTGHNVTGVSVAALIRQFVEDPGQLTADTPVVFETADGQSVVYTWADITALTYNAYADSTGQPTVRALPVLLAFGQDGTPYTDNAFHLVFGATSATDDNAARCLANVTRIVVGEDANYAQHNYGTYANLDTVSGSDVVVNIYQGDVLAATKTYTVKDIEALANANRGGIYRGLYSTLVYEDNETNYSGPYSDYYEGYNLYSVLLDAGLPESAAVDAPSSKVQFYQQGNWDDAWKTVNVSLGYLAGNGDGGVGDYSANFSAYGREDGYDDDGVAIVGMAPTIAYGKNDLPLVYASGTTGASSSAYNYRGPMIALLPQNTTEGGYVADQTVSACYLGQIDVYLPESDETLFTVSADPITVANGLYKVTYRGKVAAGQCVQVAGKTMYWDGEAYVCLLSEAQAKALTNTSFTSATGDATSLTMGDVNGNGEVNIVDVQAAYDAACGVYADFSILPETGWLAADFDRDGVVDANDALYILRSIME